MNRRGFFQSIAGLALGAALAPLEKKAVRTVDPNWFRCSILIPHATLNEDLYLLGHEVMRRREEKIIAIFADSP